jgi:hypothetical protein
MLEFVDGQTTGSPDEQVLLRNFDAFLLRSYRGTTVGADGMKLDQPTFANDVWEGKLEAAKERARPPQSEHKEDWYQKSGREQRGGKGVDGDR